ncbi:MAG TPA: ABC transporter ATP-binding protein, partial [Candidatus Woesebacteria bacterium]|nr:ABC transporter ATP-binding protein [Candidatus Woesebacteria bacterium]
PTAGMSLEETQKTAQIVKDLNRDGMAIIVIDHDMEFVRTLNSKITVLHLGKWFAEGNLAEIESNEEVRSIYLGKK